MSMHTASFIHDDVEYTYVDVRQSLPRNVSFASLPFSRRVLLENVLRTMPGGEKKDRTVACLVEAEPSERQTELCFYPARVLMHDFAIPALMDLAVMREAVAGFGGNPALVTPRIPVHVTIDHSCQVNHFGTDRAMSRNIDEEYALNHERIAFLKWADRAMDNVFVVPPAKGICHQLQLELFSQVVAGKQDNSVRMVFPDSLVGADSHTGTLGGIGIVSYGIGGIELETILLGEPSVMPLPEIIGVRLTGRLGARVTAMDLALYMTALLREKGVVQAFVEYFGPGIAHLSVPARCTVANMAPEYGATLGFFPVDKQVIDYLRVTGRSEQASLAEAATRAMGLFCDGSTEPRFARVIEVDLARVSMCIAGPARPQQHIPLAKSHDHIGRLLKKEQPERKTASTTGTQRLKHGDIALAAITSCTNTINPELIIGAGLLARNAVEQGLTVPGHVKTVLAPGSTTVTRYLADAGLLRPLEQLGFYTVGYSCLTCIGNSGPLLPSVSETIEKHNLNMAAVLSANRNFSGRVHPLLRSNFLASPMLVVAFALSGSMLTNMAADPLGYTLDKQPVYLADIMPSDEAIKEVYNSVIRAQVFEDEYARLGNGGAVWEKVTVPQSASYVWDASSTYIKRPPYFDSTPLVPEPLPDISSARVLVKFGNAVTTDHISPAGTIPPLSPAGQYLLSHGVSHKEFNTYGNRRGNHEVMVRGTFGNTRLQNQLVAPKEGAFTLKYPTQEAMYIFDAAEAYAGENTPLIVLAGTEYGTGSSRDWAAKGLYFLGVRAVIACSFERIHRSNLVGMGILPLQFMDGESAVSLGLEGSETYSIGHLNSIDVGSRVEVVVLEEGGATKRFAARARLDTPFEVTCFKHGGILPYTMRKICAPV